MTTEENNLGADGRAEKKSGALVSSLMTILITGLLALLGTIAGEVYKGHKERELARYKFQTDLIIKALDSNSSGNRFAALKLLNDLSLLEKDDFGDKIREYLADNGKNPDAIPQFSSSAPQTPVIIPQPRPTVKPSPFSSPSTSPSPQPQVPAAPIPRIYLLWGKNDSDAAQIQDKLKSSGSPIIGAKHLEDKMRPNTPEIRYFNEVDKSQAESTAKYMESITPGTKFPVNRFSDDSAKPGYIEIWLGR